jgi:hypothetical protein
MNILDNISDTMFPIHLGYTLASVARHNPNIWLGLAERLPV